jgi:hypothetical protein
MNKINAYNVSTVELQEKFAAINDLKFSLRDKQFELCEQLCSILCGCLNVSYVSKTKCNQLMVTLDLDEAEKALAILSKYYLHNLISYRHVGSNEVETHILVTIKN